MGVLVKVVGKKGYLKQGSIGIGFSAWRLAASIRYQLQLDDFPSYLKLVEWEQLSCERIAEVDLSISWKEAIEKNKKNDGNDGSTSMKLLPNNLMRDSDD